MTVLQKFHLIFVREQHFCGVSLKTIRVSPFLIPFFHCTKWGAPSAKQANLPFCTHLTCPRVNTKTSFSIKAKRAQVFVSLIGPSCQHQRRAALRRHGQCTSVPMIDQSLQNEGHGLRRRWFRGRRVQRYHRDTLLKTFSSCIERPPSETWICMYNSPPRAVIYSLRTKYVVIIWAFFHFASW
jgi:hypothetical protein